MGRPKDTGRLAKALPPNAIDALLATLEAGGGVRRDDWVERDRAIPLTALRGCAWRNWSGSTSVTSAWWVTARSCTFAAKARRIVGCRSKRRSSTLWRCIWPAGESAPGGPRRGSSPAGGLGSWPADAPLFVNAKDDTRITRHTVSTGCCDCFAEQASTLNASVAPWSTASAYVRHRPRQRQRQRLPVETLRTRIHRYLAALCRRRRAGDPRGRRSQPSLRAATRD